MNEKLTDEERVTVNCELHRLSVQPAAPYVAKEKLTNEERDALGCGMCRGGHKALRIIDAQAADNERLREKLGLTERTLLTSIRAADRELDAAEAHLATAAGLLKQARDSVGVPMWLAAGAARFLASAQPAAPARTEAEPKGPHASVHKQLLAQLTERAERVSDLYSRLVLRLWTLDTYAPQMLGGSCQFGGMVKVEKGAWVRVEDVSGAIDQPAVPAKQKGKDNG